MDFMTEGERIFGTDDSGKVVAKITFPETSDGVYTIDHTFVDDSLRGQGIAGRLVQAAVDEITSRGGTVQATCSYARRWMEQSAKDGGLPTTLS